MPLRWMCGGVIAVSLLLGTALPARADAGTDACWQLIMRAMDASAHSPRARFTTYGEKATITEDGRMLENVRSNITYRDDGLAYVEDDRWGDPFQSRYLEPGPPVLGPYGNERNTWLGFDQNVPSAFPIIANVHTHPNISCRNSGVVSIDQQPLFHLYVGEGKHRLGLHEVWINPTTFEIRRVVVVGPLRLYGNGDYTQETANYTVDVGHVDGYVVVNRVWWKYEEQIYSQTTVMDAEYDFTDYRFSDVPPPGTLQARTNGR